MKKSYLLILFFLLLSFLSPVLAATQARRPTSDFTSANTGNWSIYPSSPTTLYDKVNEVTPDDGTPAPSPSGTYIYCTTAGRRLFGFPAFSIPSGATISQLSITYRHAKFGAAACNIRSALQVGGTIYETTDPGVNPTNGVWNPTIYPYATNPNRTVPPFNWTVDDINGIGANALQYFGVRSSDATPDPYATQVYAEVTYTAPNSPPVGGYTSDNVIPAAQCVQSTDGSGLITISFRVKDADLNPCTLKTFQYSIDGGSGWAAPTNGDVSGSLSAGWTNNSSLNYTSALDFSGPVYTFTFNTKHADVSGINGTDQSDIRIRFTVNDGALDSAAPAQSDNFSVDDLNPATLTTTDIDLRPQAGDTAVTLSTSFTETHPDTNTFYLALNGGAYGAGSAGDANTASPASHATPTGAALDGNDYISQVKCAHVDDFGNSGTNENNNPTTKGVKPYTPAPPAVSNPTASSVDVTVNKNASEVAGLEYAINASSHGKYVQADGSLGDAAVWQTIAAWGTKTVTGLTPPVNNYIFKTKSRNPNGDQPESDLSGGASSTNTAPVLHNGAAENVLFVPAQATDRSGRVTFSFRIKDLELNPCSVVSGSFQYQVNGAGWNNILDSDISGTKTGLASAADLNGTTHTLAWDSSKDPGYIDNALSPNVQIRFKVNDATTDSTDGVSPLGFSVDNLDPAPSIVTDIYTQPLAGASTVTLLSSFSEANPSINNFYAGSNGGDYSTGTVGQLNTASPSPQATDLTATLQGNGYINKAKCTHVDVFGNVGNNENTSPDAAKKFAKPYTPSVATVSNPTPQSVDVKVNKYPDEISGLEYTIYVSSHGKYVQTDGSLGDTPAWQTILNWGTKTVTGLTTPISSYYFKTRSRNPADLAHQSTSDSELSDPVNSSGEPPTPEAIIDYYPGYNAEGISPEAKILVRFDRDMDKTSVQNLFTVRAIKNNAGAPVNLPVTGSFNWGSNRNLEFTPTSRFSKGYTYQVNLSGNAKDYDENPVLLDLTWSFRIVMDREIRNSIVSADGRVIVALSLGAMSADASININRDPLNHPREINPGLITAANEKALARGDQYFHPLALTVSEINAYGVDDIRFTGNFAAPVTVIIKYDDENNDGVVDGTSPQVLARGLVMYRLDETNGLWVKVPGSTAHLGENEHYISADVNHFSVYMLMATAAGNLAEAYAFPNPFIPSKGHTTITFVNISSDSKIKIFTLTGDLVKTISAAGGTGQVSWDVKNEQGENLASGLYYYIIESSQDAKKGKLVIVR